MPALRRKTRQRNCFGDGHKSQLAHGHDFFGDGFGRLAQLSNEQLAEALTEMQSCWAQHREEIIELAAPSRPWFEAYADGVDRLTAEVAEYKSHCEKYPHGDRCRCERCKSITPATARVTAAE